MKKKGLLRSVLPISLIVVMAVALPLFSGCLGEPAAAPPEEVAPAAPEVVTPAAPEAVAPPDAYEEYVAGLPEGILAVPRDAFEQAMEEGELFVYDWAEWWPDEIFEGFTQEYGIVVTRDHFGTHEEAITKFRLYPETPYDILKGMSGEHLYYMKAINALGELNPDWLPNVFANAPEELAQESFDPGGRYSVANYLWLVAYHANVDIVDDPRLPSWAVLFDPTEDTKGRVTLIDKGLDVIGAALKYLGYNFYSDDEGELMEARELLLQLKPDLMAFDSWPVTLLYSDEAWIAHGYYSDGWFLNAEYEAIVPQLPTEGTRLGTDIMFNPIGSPHPAAAHLFMDYAHRPEVNVLLPEGIFAYPTNLAARELVSPGVMEKIEIPEEYLDKCDTFDVRAITGRGLELRTEIWEELR